MGTAPQMAHQVKVDGDLSLEPYRWITFVVPHHLNFHPWMFVFLLILDTSHKLFPVSIHFLLLFRLSSNFLLPLNLEILSCLVGLIQFQPLKSDSLVWTVILGLQE